MRVITIIRVTFKLVGLLAPHVYRQIDTFLGVVSTVTILHTKQKVPENSKLVM